MRLTFHPCSVMAVLLAMLSIAPARAADDAQAIKRAFAPCTSCHNNAPGASTKIGPNLYGIFGKRAATADARYDYSPALKASGVVWTEESLKAFLKSPRSFLPGSKMTFRGVMNDKSLTDIVTHLRAHTQE